MSPSSTRTILIAEDEEAVKMLAVFAFRSKGYDVLSASTAEEALELWHDHKDEVVLLFTDLSMPGEMSGFDLARQLRSTHPHLPIIFTSGDVADTADYDPSLQHSVKHLLKPYRPSELLIMVAGMLPAATAAA